MLLLVQIDSHIKRLDEDLNNFAEDLKQGTETLEAWLFLGNASYFTM